MTGPPPSWEKEFLIELRQIRKILAQLNRHPFLVAHHSLKKAFFLSVMKGIATGFGTVLGATLVVSWFLYLLSHIEVIPIVGDWVRLIIQEVQVGHPG